MPIIIRMVIALVITNSLLPWMACGSERHIAKKPEGLRMESPDPYNPYLSIKDRELWKSVLNWCDECDERARLPNDDSRHGGIFIYPIGDKQYIVDIYCEMGMHDSENLYYKIWVNKDNIESRLLILEQYDYYPANGVKVTKNEPEGEFVRFSDSLSWGSTLYFPKKCRNILILDQVSGGCGFYTVYDVSGDSPKVKELRANIFCSPESPPVEKWKRYPARQRAKWRVVHNPQREYWKSSPIPFETRCGWWYNNPSENDIFILDREGKWSINAPSGNQLLGESDRPVFTPDQKIKTKFGDEYGCVCMDAKVSLKSRRFFEVKNIRIQSPDVCRQDPGLKRWKHKFK
ncbi:MAG: DUF4087 domain-containing protein [Desulfatitalea sp.]